MFPKSRNARSAILVLPLVMSAITTTTTRFEFVLKEIIDAVLWIGGIFVLGFILVFNNFFTLLKQSWTPVSSNTMLEEHLLDTLTSTDFSLSPAEEKTTSSSSAFSTIAVIQDQAHTYGLESYLGSRMKHYKTPFSLLPPGKHIRINNLSVQAPIYDVSYASSEQMEKGLFKQELKQGVVKYPFTAEPGSIGNTLLFGHSSVDYREGKDNPYGFIFSQLHELAPGDTIEVVRNGKKHEYIVEETVIKNPKEVGSVINQYADKKYLTLMACYPRFSTAKRIMVIAKETGTALENPQVALDHKTVVN